MKRPCKAPFEKRIWLESGKRSIRVGLARSGTLNCLGRLYSAPLLFRFDARVILN